MTDVDLSALGGVVSFIVAAGGYCFARERFAGAETKNRAAAVPVRVEKPGKPRRVA